MPANTGKEKRERTKEQGSQSVWAGKEREKEEGIYPKSERTETGNSSASIFVNRESRFQYGWISSKYGFCAFHACSYETGQGTFFRVYSIKNKLSLKIRLLSRIKTIDRGFL